MSAGPESLSDKELIKHLRWADGQLYNLPEIAEALARILEKEYYISPVNGNCLCPSDWTDGTGWCDNCRKERKGLL